VIPLPSGWWARTLMLLAILLAASTPALIVGAVVRDYDVDRIRATEFDVCTRGNLTRGIIRRNTEVIHLLTHDRDGEPHATEATRRAHRNQQTTAGLLRIVNCEATVRTGERVVLAPAQDRAYVRLISTGVLPEVEDGRVVAP
jgi:hypothetical protein